MIINIIIIILCIAADQISKLLVEANLTEIRTFPLIEDILHFTYVENEGAAFGMLANHRWVFMTLSVIGIAAVFVYLSWQKPKKTWDRLALCFIIGGGIGNMIDRIRLGYVIDFIDCRFINFYVFNVADSFVCVGCAMYLISVMYDEIKLRKSKKEKAADNADGEANNG